MSKLYSSKDIIQHLEKNGFTLDRARTRGSHLLLNNKNSGAVITVPHPMKSLPVAVVKSIMKQVEISKMKD